MSVLHQLAGLFPSAPRKSDQNERPMSDVQTTEVQATEVQATEVQTTEDQETEVQTTEVQKNELQRNELQSNELKTMSGVLKHTLPLRLLAVFQVYEKYSDETRTTELLMNGRLKSVLRQSEPMTSA